MDFLCGPFSTIDDLSILSQGTKTNGKKCVKCEDAVCVKCISGVKPEGPYLCAHRLKGKILITKLGLVGW